ncbi:hypothetical protein K502DRAFT_362958 [Neoconidiobolus thromboides FSU 785]|nr:hypothetical protein K502DRAFT_362958 [Neoconidiobolus thromboides FSU 785]
MILASLGYLSPIAVLSDLIYYFINGKKMIQTQYGCTVYGFIVLFIYQYEIILSSLLSIERLSKIKKPYLFSYIYHAIVINLILFTILLIACAVTNSFALSSTKVSCLLDVVNNVLASITYHYSLLNCLIAIIILIYSYYCLASQISGLSEIISVESEYNFEATSGIRFTSLKNASLKVYLILVVYGICMLGSLICLFIESTLKYKYGDFFKQAKDLNSTASLLFIFGMIFNVLLILTLHTGITNEVKCFIQKVRNK